MDSGIAGFMIITMLVMIVLFLVLRDFVCWYWKINTTVDVLNKILAELKDINRSGVRSSENRIDSVIIDRPTIVTNKTTCPHCGKSVQLSLDELKLGVYICSWCNKEATVDK
jgi:hypothetical protein